MFFREIEIKKDRYIERPCSCILVYLRGGSVGEDVYFSASELDDSLDECEECVVLAHADVESGFELCSALANDDRTSLCQLAAVELYAAILRITVSAVS